jgi:quinol monooxygenase YgiN
VTLLGIAHFRFHAGRVDEFRRLSEQCLEIVRTRDTGTLRYDIYPDADGSAATVVEEYRDEAALAEHSAHLGAELTRAVLATGDVHGELLGDVSPELLAELAGGPVRAFALALSLGGGAAPGSASPA